jgi:hypothetical protein
MGTAVASLIKEGNGQARDPRAFLDPGCTSRQLHEDFARNDGADGRNVQWVPLLDLDQIRQSEVRETCIT